MPSSTQNPTGSPPVAPSQRLFAFGIDMVVIIIVGYWLGSYLSEYLNVQLRTYEEGDIVDYYRSAAHLSVRSINGVTMCTAVGIAYFAVAEAMPWNTSPGKRLLRLKVQRTDNLAPSSWDILLRSFFKVVLVVGLPLLMMTVGTIFGSLSHLIEDLLFLGTIIGWIVLFILASVDRDNRFLSDKWSKTRIVRY